MESKVIKIGDKFTNEDGHVAIVKKIIEPNESYIISATDIHGFTSDRYIKQKALLDGVFFKGRQSKYYVGAEFDTLDGGRIVITGAIDKHRRLVMNMKTGEEKVMYKHCISRKIVANENNGAKLEIGRRLISDKGLEYVIIGKPSIYTRDIQFIKSGIVRRIHCASLYNGHVSEIAHKNHKVMSDRDIAYCYKYRVDTIHTNKDSKSYLIVAKNKYFFTVRFLDSQNMVIATFDDILTGDFDDNDNREYKPGTVCKNSKGEVFGISRADDDIHRDIMFLKSKHNMTVTVQQIKNDEVFDDKYLDITTGCMFSTKNRGKVVIKSYVDKVSREVKFVKSGICKVVLIEDLLKGNIDDRPELLKRNGRL